MVNELKSKNVKLCDLNNNFDSYNESIDMLIGADIAGKLFTGNKFHLSNGLTVLESKLGWTVMGKESNDDERSDIALTTLSMFITESKISDLWSLDTLGIKDPIVKSNQLENEQNAKLNFSENSFLK